ncbi:hypothetical protein JCM24511_05388 [Saitozyma sp. JCM 24511]|nr:hypothetical protein JCM24511_05388 [Saitozyma sp. JCM 24511]
MTDPTPRSPSPSPSPLLDARLPALHPSTHPHVFVLIAAHADRPTLVSLARTSQEMHLLLAPQLYHTVDFRNILPYNPRKPGEPVVITEHDEDICTRQLECAGMTNGFDLPNLETLRVVQSPRSSFKPLSPRCTAFRHLKPKVISIVGHECPGHRHSCVPYLPVPSERLVFVQGIELDVGPWNLRPVPCILRPSSAQLRVEVIIWSLYAIAWNRNGIKRHGAARALKVLLGTESFVPFSTVLDRLLRAPVQSVELVFGKMAVGRASKWDRSIGLFEFSSETLCEEFRSVCPPISEHEGGDNQSEYRVTAMEEWVEQGRWKGVLTPREAERLPLD